MLGIYNHNFPGVSFFDRVPIVDGILIISCIHRAYVIYIYKITYVIMFLIFWYLCY